MVKQSKAPLTRATVFPESELPDASALLAEGRQLANSTSIGPCPFLIQNEVSTESTYKRARASQGKIMLHAQIGYRDLQKSRRAYAEIYESLSKAGYYVDRYGICLDWSMGYPAAVRRDMPRGTGLILDTPDDFVALTQQAPVAPHFGDFVMGTPAALENTQAALAAGSTAIGNLGQYFNFRMPHWHDDIETTASTLKALALAAAQSHEVLIHSNLDDGFASLFHDLACTLGAVLVERYIVGELIGGHVSHCYGHTFSDPLTRSAFQQALANVSETPGTMIYGNTTAFTAEPVENYATLANYLLIDILAQKTAPTGHAVNPVPVSEALRIPDIQEIIDAHIFCHRLIEHAAKLQPLIDMEAASPTAELIETGGRQFFKAILAGLEGIGIDTKNPFEMLLALRRIGAKHLEQLYGPGKPGPTNADVRLPMVKASPISELQNHAQRCLDALDPETRETIRGAQLVGCLATTDVHEYGKLLLETVLQQLGVQLVDAGVSIDPDVLAETARGKKVDFIALSTYNGVALDYLKRLRNEMDRHKSNIPVFIGGKLNQVPEGSQDSLPVDVSHELRAVGAIVCYEVKDMLKQLAQMKRVEPKSVESQ